MITGHQLLKESVTHQKLIKHFGFIGKFLLECLTFYINIWKILVLCTGYDWDVLPYIEVLLVLANLPLLRATCAIKKIVFVKMDKKQPPPQKNYQLLLYCSHGQPNSRNSISNIPLINVFHFHSFYSSSKARLQSWSSTSKQSANALLELGSVSRVRLTMTS